MKTMLATLTNLILVADLYAQHPAQERSISGNATNVPGNNLQSRGTSAVRGGLAMARLKEPGHYDSLRQAMQVARYAVATVEGGAGMGQGPTYGAANPAPALRCRFDADGVELRPDSERQSPWKLRLRLSGYGRALLGSVGAHEITAKESRVELSRASGGVLEWYENQAAGLEQGFTVLDNPPGAGPLRLILEAEGDLRPELETGNTGVQFVTANGETALCYSGLRAWDAMRRDLAAHIEVHGRKLALVVNDQNAEYPVTIDPLITSQEAKFEPDSGVGGFTTNRFGASVSLSSDGNTALVAGSSTRGAYVFVRSGGLWNLQTFLAAGESANTVPVTGNWVGLSGDGNTALVGASGESYSMGSAYIFVRSGSSWSQQAKLVAVDAATGEEFGYSVSLNSDGSVAVVGAVGDDGGRGSAYVFTRSGSTWSQQAKLTASDGTASDNFGFSISLSGDANTAIVGASWNDNARGSAYLFVRNGGTWSQQSKLTASDGANSDLFGCSVSLSGDGNTALVGASGHTWATRTHCGGAYVFVRSGITWGQQAELNAADALDYDWFGSSVSLSADGNTALLGAPYDDLYPWGQAGSAYVFVRSGTAWSQQAKTITSNYASWDTFGSAVCLSGDGSTALGGAPGHITSAGDPAGSAYVFVVSGTNWLQQAELTDSQAGTDYEYFGHSVALSSDGNTALVGADGDLTTGGEDAGSASVFVRSGSTWNRQAQLTAIDGTTLDWFGRSVSLSSDGSAALVGALEGGSPLGGHEGAAYVFVRSGSNWIQQAKLMASDGVSGDEFGCSVFLSADGNIAVVGADLTDVLPILPNGLEGAGTVYVFVRSGTNWSQQAELTPTDRTRAGRFGLQVALSRDSSTMLVSDNSWDTYIFEWNGAYWSQQAKLAGVGNTVSLSTDGGTALVGAPGDLGNAYVLVRSGASWSQQAKLTPNDRPVGGYGGDEFGSSVFLSGDGNIALVGSQRSDQQEYLPGGAAYLFVRSGSTWSQQAKIYPDPGVASFFGNSVCLSSDATTALVGAYLTSYYSSSTSVNCGSAYVFRILLPDLQNRLTAQLLSSGAVRLTYLGGAGTNYVLDRTFNFKPTVVWTPQATNPADSSGYVIFTNAPIPATNNFWRIRSTP
jgi:hypothetical protein